MCFANDSGSTTKLPNAILNVPIFGGGEDREFLEMFEMCLRIFNATVVGDFLDSYVLPMNLAQNKPSCSSVVLNATLFGVILHRFFQHCGFVEADLAAIHMLSRNHPNNCGV